MDTMDAVDPTPVGADDPAARCPYAGAASAGIDRRTLVRRALAVALGVPASVVLAACGGGPGEGGPMDDGMPGGMMSDGAMDGRMMRDMRVIRDLLGDHGEIRRRVDDVPGGISSVTTSADHQVAELIRTHVRQMKGRVERGDVIRPMDPLFQEIFDHHTAIHMEIDDVADGVRVTETSDDPQVTLLIRQHARRAVSEFVAEGMPRAMEPTPLPAGYRP